MKKQLTLFIFLLISVSSISQIALDKNEPVSDERMAITAGILQGGGSLIGSDLEILLTDRFGIQAGCGLVGFGAGFNFHLKPGIRTHFISIQYWNQGIGQSFSQNVIGGNFVYRGKKWFTCQLGLGAPLSKGPAWPSGMVHPPLILMYSIGAYFPLK